MSIHADEPRPGGPDPSAGTRWGVRTAFDVESFNADLADGEPTVDVAVCYPDNLLPAHRRRVHLETVIEGLGEAKRIFRSAGVQLALLSVRTGRVDPALLSVHAEAPGSELPGDRYTNFYTERQRRPARVSDGALAVLGTMVGDGPHHDRRIHLVVLQDVFMSFYEQVDRRTWQMKTLATGAMSFPGYSHRDTLPRRLRGVITITDLAKPHSWKTVTHELGHKLINAGHEYRDVDPRHEVYAEGGLLLYGSGIDIPSGRAGRFHRERLHLSPFVYRKSRTGTKVWNPDYRDGGGYYDRTYQGFTIDIDPPADQ